MSIIQTKKINIQPLIFVFDIDGTLIGDIKNQIMLYELHMTLRKMNKKVTLINMKIFHNNLLNGIIRPYFIKFIKKIQEHYKNVEFFIYTASERKWATFLVSQLEKVIGIKFNRPIFARDNCILHNNDFKKSLKSIRKCILKTLKKKYIITDSDIDDRILIIDNRDDVYNSDDTKHTLVCPTYDYAIPENIPGIINESLYKSYNLLIQKILERYNALQQISSQYSYIDFQRNFYTRYIQDLEKVKNENNIHVNDKYFLYLMNILINKNITKFTPNMVVYISKKLNKKLNI